MRRFVVSAMVAAMCVSAALAKGPNNPANFETAKAKMSENASKRLAIVEEFKKCVDSAADMAALKECAKKERAAMKELRPPKKPKGPKAEANATAK